MTLQRASPGKINLLLNLLGRRADGFQELETLFHPLPMGDQLQFSRADSGIQLACSQPDLSIGPDNLVHRAASVFLAAAGIHDGVRIHLEKNLPLAAGLGGGSSNAAIPLLGLNDLFDRPLPPNRIVDLAATLGSDVPFFLQDRPALGTGRGDRIEPLEFFPALEGAGLLLVHPGFGVSTAWAYQELAQFPEALHGQPGRARRLADRLQTGSLTAAAGDFYNALEAPVFLKYPLLALYRDFFRAEGAPVALMSGSGSTVFTLLSGRPAADRLRERFLSRFGEGPWTACAVL